jgi:hypothetical protein
MSRDVNDTGKLIGSSTCCKAATGYTSAQTMLGAAMAAAAAAGSEAGAGAGVYGIYTICTICSSRSSSNNTLAVI